MCINWNEVLASELSQIVKYFSKLLAVTFHVHQLERGIGN